jgi:hypothetical protein
MTLKIELELPDVVLTVRIGDGEPVDFDPYVLNAIMEGIEIEWAAEADDHDNDGTDWRWSRFHHELAKAMGVDPQNVRRYQVIQCFEMAKAIIEAEAEASKKKRESMRIWLLSSRGFPPAGSNGRRHASDDGTTTFRASEPSESIMKPSSDTTAPSEPTTPN